MPRTRRSTDVVVQLIDNTGESLLCSKFLNARLYDAEKKLNLERVCDICLEAADACCAQYLRCGHGPYHLRCLLSMAKIECPICRI